MSGWMDITSVRGAASGGAGSGRLVRGFSLVEVLMAVLILGLGLLGLGAIMPVVVKQQRTGADRVQGTIAARSAIAVLEGHGRMGPEFWRQWAETLPDNALGLPSSLRGFSNLLPEDGLWFVATVDATTGNINLGPQKTSSNPSAGEFAVQPVRIPLIDRLYPSPSAGLTVAGSQASGVAFTGNRLVPPSFVFDVAARRLSARNVVTAPLSIPEASSKVQVAIFVRRIDQEIRPRVESPTNPADRTLPTTTDVDAALVSALVDPTVPTDRRRWPVSEDEVTGEPTLDGRFAAESGGAAGRYSQLLRLAVEFTPGANWPRDRIVLVDPQSGQGAFGPGVVARNVIQPGQRIVDNFGNVYRVLGRDERTADPLAMRIDPPVPGWVEPTVSASGGGLREVLATLQPPAEVLVRTMNP
jgi:prepilin-type N-terminal cleavage/methylation domain-containing protein